MIVHDVIVALFHSHLFFPCVTAFSCDRFFVRRLQSFETTFFSGEMNTIQNDHKSMSDVPSLSTVPSTISDSSDDEEQQQERARKWRQLHRAQLSFTEDAAEIMTHFFRHGRIHIPLVHGSGSWRTVSDLAVIMLDDSRMLVGRHMHGAIVVERAEDIQTLYKTPKNDLGVVPADAVGLVNLLECLYSYRCEPRSKALTFVDASMFIGGRKRSVFVVQDIIDFFAPYNEWWPLQSVYVAVVGMGSWLTPQSSRLSTYSDQYIAEKTGLHTLSKEEQEVHITAMKAL